MADRGSRLFQLRAKCSTRSVDVLVVVVYLLFFFSFELGVGDRRSRWIWGSRYQASCEYELHLLLFLLFLKKLEDKEDTFLSIQWASSWLFLTHIACALHLKYTHWRRFLKGLQSIWETRRIRSSPAGCVFYSVVIRKELSYGMCVETIGSHGQSGQEEEKKVMQWWNERVVPR